MHWSYKKNSYSIANINLETIDMVQNIILARQSPIQRNASDFFALVDAVSYVLDDNILAETDSLLPDNRSAVEDIIPAFV